MLAFRDVLNQSLARRLMVGAGLYALVVLAIIVVVLSAVYRSQVVTLLDDELDRTLVTLARAVDTDGRGGLRTRAEALPSDPVYQTPLSGRYWVVVGFDEDGKYDAILNSNSLWDGEIPWPESNTADLLARPGTIFRANGTGSNDEPVRMVAQALILPNRETPVMLLAAFDRSETDRGAERFSLLLLFAMTLLGAGILFALWLGIRSALRPLRRVEADVADVREGRRTRLEGDYPSEVRPLSEELNKLLEHNRGVVERARTHVGNLAHALKTPIAVLMNEASGDGPLDDVVRRQAGAMHANVQHYLKRAQAAARAQTLGARADLAPVLADLSRLLNKLFSSKGISVTTDTADGLVFRGERQDLEEMIGNLMENGCKWARSKVHVSAGTEGDRLVVHVDDDGDGLEEEDRAAAMQRGVRLDEAAPGTGLGLSIVTELAELHEGTFQLDRAPDLGGLRATLRLPRA